MPGSNTAKVVFFSIINLIRFEPFFSLYFFLFYRYHGMTPVTGDRELPILNFFIIRYFANQVLGCQYRVFSVALPGGKNSGNTRFPVIGTVHEIGKHTSHIHL